MAILTGYFFFFAVHWDRRKKKNEAYRMWPGISCDGSNFSYTGLILDYITTTPQPVHYDLLLFPIPL